jgi:hypothetical protein
LIGLHFGQFSLKKLIWSSCKDQFYLPLERRFAKFFETSDILLSIAGLPDGIFSNQKSQ